MNKNVDFLQFLKSLNWKVFIMTFVTAFGMVALQKIGVHVPNMAKNVLEILRPIPKTADVYAEVKTKLHTKPSSYNLHSDHFLISQSYAATTADFDAASSYIVTDYDTGTVLLDKNQDSQESIASLTKLMSAVVALDLAKPTDEFTVSSYARTVPPTAIGVVSGQQMSVEELLNAMLLTSANDAAEVMRQGVDTKYQHPVFVTAMNEKAAFLGLTHTHFDNPQGFDGSGNYSSSHDLAVLAHYALTQYPLIAAIVQKPYQFLPASSTHKQFDLNNWNGLVGVYPGVKGVKIGNTDKAGYTTIVLSEQQGKKVLAVLLGAPKLLSRDLWVGELLDAGFEKVGNIASFNVTEEQLQAKYATWHYW